MTIPVWPDDLPCSVVMGSLQTGPRGLRLATSPDTGPPKMRRRGPRIMTASGTIKATADQRARFDVFWEEETAGGVLPFLFRDQQMDGYRLGDDLGAMLMTEDDVPIQIESWWLVQFGQQQPTYSRITGRSFQIQFDLLVLP